MKFFEQEVERQKEEYSVESYNPNLLIENK
jgi:hypothetical protein